MNGRLASPIVLVCACAAVLVGCSSGAVPGTPTSGGASASSAPASATEAPGDAPKVPNPLPASALNGNPCDAALTSDQVTGFIGTTKSPQSREIDSGPACTWFSVDGVSGQINVYYNTKVGDGLNAAYQNARPNADRWEPTTVQGYPAVAYTQKGMGQSTTGTCNVFVGIRDDLTFGVGLTVGDNARARGVDSCAGANKVANAVLTNIKGRS